jgi:hypothetical protein
VNDENDGAAEIVKVEMSETRDNRIRLDLNMAVGGLNVRLIF